MKYEFVKCVSKNMCCWADKCYETSSFTETNAQKWIEKEGAAFVQHTMTKNVRIYPKGTRIFSANYLPVTHWSAGAQMVALNYQTAGPSIHLNAALFRDNGRVGFVLKPPLLIDRFVSFLYTFLHNYIFLLPFYIFTLKFLSYEHRLI